MKKSPKCKNPNCINGEIVLAGLHYTDISQCMFCAFENAREKAK